MKNLLCIVLLAGIFSAPLLAQSQEAKTQKKPTKVPNQKAGISSPRDVSTGLPTVIEKESASGISVVRPPDLKPTKSACLAIFFFNDSNFSTLVQNAQVNLQHCIDGYDKSVLLKEDFNSVGQTRPTVLLKPNKEVFLNQIKELADDGYWIDIRIFTHGSIESIPLANGKNLTASELAEELSYQKTGYRKLPIRSVYQMNCFGHTFNQTWLALGAKVVSGARYVNFYPNQFNKFASEWNKGNVSYTSSLAESNTESSRSVMQAAIQADAMKDIAPKNWDKCPIGKTVLGDHPCSKSYFSANWGFDNSEWQSGQSGKDNMNYSSYMFRVGDINLTKNNKSALVWER